jgi:hypothetical protein
MWGVVGYEALEQDRPQFEGEVIKSPVDGKPMKYFASGEKNFRSRVANVSTAHVIYARLPTSCSCVAYQPVSLSLSLSLSHRSSLI